MAEERPPTERPAARPAAKPAPDSGFKSEPANLQPSNPTPPQKSGFKWGSGMGCLVILGVVAVGLVSWGIIASSQSSVPSQEDMNANAEINCEDLVKQGLKSPSTAQFSGENVSGSDTMVVTGSVDSENSFGAKLRSDFQCTATVNGDKVDIAVDYIR